jgi:hypothetical protein
MFNKPPINNDSPFPGKSNYYDPLKLPNNEMERRAALLAKIDEIEAAMLTQGEIDKMYVRQTNRQGGVTAEQEIARLREGYKKSRVSNERDTLISGTDEDINISGVSA